MVREVENIFLDFPDNKCFACHPSNKIGLKLKFFADDSTGEVFTRVKPAEHFAGFPGILHGGIQCALVDEVAFWAMFEKIKKIGLTTKIEIDYNKKVDSSSELEVRGKVSEIRGRYVVVNASIKDSCGDECTSSKVTYFLPRKEVLFEVFGEERFAEKFLKYIEE